MDKIDRKDRLEWSKIPKKKGPEGFTKVDRKDRIDWPATKEKGKKRNYKIDRADRTAGPGFI